MSGGIGGDIYLPAGDVRLGVLLQISEFIDHFSVLHHIGPKRRQERGNFQESGAEAKAVETMKIILVWGTNVASGRISATENRIRSGIIATFW